MLSRAGVDFLQGPTTAENIRDRCSFALLKWGMFNHSPGGGIIVGLVQQVIVAAVPEQK